MSLVINLYFLGGLFNYALKLYDDIYITEANKQQVVKSFVQNIRFMINAVSYPLDGNFIFVFPTIIA
jgi:hypothetical protein